MAGLNYHLAISYYKPMIVKHYFLLALFSAISSVLTDHTVFGKDCFTKNCWKERVDNGLRKTVVKNRAIAQW